MSNRLYIGNLNRATTEETLRRALHEKGHTVTKVNLKTKASTGRSRGFAFIDLESEEHVQAAIESLHGTTLDDRTIKVSTAKVQREPSMDYEHGHRGRGFGGRGRRS
jgi:RNA recognition motif-containing protein